MELKYGYREADTLDVVTEIEKLPFLHQIAFAASACERLILDDNISEKETNEKKPSVVRLA